MKEQSWDQWLRLCIRDKSSPIELPPARPTPMAMLTGQDSRALGAIAACWKLYARADDKGAHAALDAVRALLPALQPKCRAFARELIAFALDWDDRARLWPLVVSGETTDCNCYLDCGSDSLSGLWHQHEDEPCPAHPSAPRVG